MLNVFKRSKLHHVRALLGTRVTRACAQTLQEGARHGARGALCEVAVLVPPDGDRGWDFAAARPVVTRDMSATGLSIVDDALVEDERLLVGLRCDGGFRFLDCQVRHCTHLGYGFFQIGFQPTEVVTPDVLELATFERRLAEVEAESGSPEETAELAHA